VWLDSDLEFDPERSAYRRLEVAWIGAIDAATGWRLGRALRYRDPRDRASRVTLDLRLERRMLDVMVITLQVDRLFDREVSELHGILFPGRWLGLTVASRKDGP
jgi:hypothetical protein